MRSFIGWFVIGWLAAGAGGCAAVSWKNTQLEDTSGDYQRFIENYPNDPRCGEAKERIEYLDFETAEKEDSIAAYEKFIAQHPSCRRAHRAQQRIKELRQRAQEERDGVQKRKRLGIHFGGGKISVETTTQD